MSLTLQLTVGLLFPLLGMTLLWLVVGRRVAGIVDVAWALMIGMLGLFYAVTSSSGLGWRRMVVAVCIFLWAVRLAGHLMGRLSKEKEDARYIELKKGWGKNAEFKLFGFYIIQAITVFGFSIVVLVASHSPAALNGLDALGLIVWLVAMIGETVADVQLSRFKKSNHSPGETCNVGLWRYSRHPNYFFEWLHWFSYVFFSLLLPWGWLTVLAPLVMLYFILYVTGVPPTEKQSLKSRPESYRKYQETTSVFFPWPPKR